MVDADWEALAHRVRVMDTWKPNASTPIQEGMDWLLDMAALQLETTKYMIEKLDALPREQ
jgi:hypothetical protein